MSEEKSLNQRLKSLVVECDKFAYSDYDSFSDSEINSSEFSNLDLSNISEISDIGSINYEENVNLNKEPVKKAQVKKISRIPVRGKRNTENIKRVNHALSKPKPISFPSKVGSVTPIGIVKSIGINYSKYTQMTICIFQGSGFLHSLGVRSTYVTLNFSDTMDPITTPICWNHNEESFYNFGLTVDVKNIDWNNCTPYFNVFDVLPDQRTELIGSGIIKLQESQEEGTVCVVLHNNWVPIMDDYYQNCGRIKMTIILHNNENIDNYLKQVEDPPLVQTLHFDDPVVEEVQNDANKYEFSTDGTEEDSIISSTDFSTRKLYKNKPWATTKWENINDKSKKLDEIPQSPPEKIPILNPQPKICFVDSSALIDSDDDEAVPNIENSSQISPVSDSFFDSSASIQFHKTKRKPVNISDSSSTQYASKPVAEEKPIIKSFHRVKKPRNKNLDLELTLGASQTIELPKNKPEPAIPQPKIISQNPPLHAEQAPIVESNSVSESHLPESTNTEIPKLYQYSITPTTPAEEKPAKKMFFSSRRTPATKKSSENVQKYFDAKWNE